MKIDAADLVRLSGKKLRICGGYMAFSVGPKTIYVHKWIMDCPKGKRVDHKNGDKLDNRRENLRICTHAENIRNRPIKNKNNTSGQPGVWLHKCGKWVGEIKVNGKKITLGLFVEKQDAIAARLTAEVVHFGAFASVAAKERAVCHA